MSALSTLRAIRLTQLSRPSVPCRRVVGLLLLLIAPWGCLGGRVQTSENLDTILWVQQSAEYRLATRQAYALAELRLREAHGDATWFAVPHLDADAHALSPSALESGAPPDPCTAVVLDVDETVLDNSGFDARLLAEGKAFEWDDWNAWQAGDHGHAIEGAPGFLDLARSMGVRVFFVTNRHHRYEAATQQNLQRLGLFAPGDQLLTRAAQEDWSEDKSSRRAFVASQCRVLLLIGDDLNDFVHALGRDNANRRELAAQHGSQWGRTWIAIPSPVYGSWLGAIVSDDELDPEQRHQRKLRALRLD